MREVLSIGISVRSIGEKEFELMVRDNSMGMLKEIEGRKCKSPGLDVSNALVKQVKGHIEIPGNNGPGLRVRFIEV